MLCLKGILMSWHVGLSHAVLMSVNMHLTEPMCFDAFPLTITKTHQAKSVKLAFMIEWVGLECFVRFPLLHFPLLKEIYPLFSAERKSYRFAFFGAYIQFG